MGPFQYTANPLNPPYQGDFEDFAPVEIIGKCILISRVYYNFRFLSGLSRDSEIPPTEELY